MLAERLEQWAKRHEVIGEQRGKLEGKLELVTHQLRRKFKQARDLDSLLERLPALSGERLEELADALLDFTSIDDFKSWLNH
jgi:hypothetical protein